MLRETERVLKIDGEVYRVYKFPALTGVYFLKFLVEKLLPALRLLQKGDTGEVADMLLPVLKGVSKEDLNVMMCTCLSYAERQLPAGFVRIADMAGHFQVSEMEYDLGLCLKVCVEVLKLNLEGFFGEGGLVSTMLPKITAL